MRFVRPLLIASIVLFALSSCSKKDAVSPSATVAPLPDSIMSVRTSDHTYPYTDTFRGILSEVGEYGSPQNDSMVTFYVFHVSADSLKITYARPILLWYCNNNNDYIDALIYPGYFHVNTAGYYSWFVFPKDSGSNGLRIHLKADTLNYDSREEIDCGDVLWSSVTAKKI